MLDTMNPQFLYYALLFVLTMVLRFIRTYKLEKKTWQNYFFFSFEFVNVSAGVFIMLSEQASNYVAAIMIGYVILVVISFFLDEEKIGLKLKTTLHIIVTIMVLVFTYFSFALWIKQPQTRTGIENTYRVSIPYRDSTLVRYVGGNGNHYPSVFVVEISASSIDDAKAKAKLKFNDPLQEPRPFDRRQEKTEVNMIKLDDKIVAEKLVTKQGR